MDSKTLKVLFIFILSYLAMFILSIISPLNDMNFFAGFDKLDYSLLLLPIVGFFFIYLLIPWLKKELGFGDTFVYSFPVIFAIGGYFAFFVAINWYFANQATLSGVELSAFNLNVFDMFLKSEYIFFVIGGIFGWATRVVTEYFESQ